MINLQPNDVILHGEAMIFLSTLPAGAKKIKPSNDKFHIIADSETTGNHHVVDVDDSTEFYTDDEGRMFMVTEKPNKVSCVHTDRHSPIEFAPGTYEFGIQKEYDHFEQHLRKVRD